jgi:hypothetical protein
MCLAVEDRFMEKTNFSYFRYHSGAQMPVFVKVDLSLHEAALPALLESMRFVEMTADQAKHVGDELAGNTNGRLMTIVPAGVSAGRQIDAAVHSDQYGKESVISKNGYKVYRYKGQALIVYSYGAKEWECGVLPSFSQMEYQEETRSILGRYLSWALAPLGLISFWGVPVEEGLVVLKQKDSNGEMVFLDVRQSRILSIDGVKPFPPRMKVLRLDEKLHNRNIKMSKEELLSFLSLGSGFLDPGGLNIATRQLIHSLVLMCEGVLHPKESFQSRSDRAL